MDIKNDMESWKHGVIRATNKMFRNTECVFIEYHDCIHLTGFVVLKAIQDSCKDIMGIDLDQISILDITGLFQWYLQREHRNFLIDLWDKDKEIPYKELDAFLAAQYSSNEIYQIPFTSAIPEMILATVQLGLVENIVVYAEELCTGIIEDSVRIFGDTVKVVGGNLATVLDEIPVDTTYIFSDFEKVTTLVDTGHLEGSAVLLPSNYRYNFIQMDDGTLQPIINTEYLSKTYHFSLGFVDLSG